MVELKLKYFIYEFHKRPGFTFLGRMADQNMALAVLWEQALSSTA
jgi:hypothetical protein